MVAETTPLLGSRDARKGRSLARRLGYTPFRLLLIPCFLLSISMVSTWTPTFALLRKFTCEALYDEGRLPPYEGTGDRCVSRLVEAETAKAITKMTAMGTFAGVTNLLMASFLTRRSGVKLTMLFQTIWPTLRTLGNLLAAYIGGRPGIALFQWSQLSTIAGGAAGFMLCANTYVAALVPPEERTPSFGILQGIGMLGIALGYALGGFLSDFFGELAPFQSTTALFVLAGIIATFLPYLPPASKPSTDDFKASAVEDDEGRGTGLFSFLAPFRVFLPRVIEPADGSPKRRYWGMTLLGFATFTGILAISYVPFALQLIGTNVYGFEAKDNGVLLSLNSVCRAIFLTSIFPRIIACGRKWYTTATLSTPVLPLSPPPSEEIASVEPVAVLGETSAEPSSTPVRPDVSHGSRFDLVFVIFSMAADGVLTGLTMWNRQGWHLYLAAAILPLASGTAPAVKGTLMALVPKHHQSDALSAVALLEMSAMVATVSVFGSIFAVLSTYGLANYIFAINALLAFTATGIYAFVDFAPPEKSRDSATAGGV